MKKVTLVLITLFSFTFIQAASLDLSKVNLEAKESKIDTLKVQTSAVCKMCKERLEHDMAFEKGVKAVELNMDDKVLTIVYRNDKTTEEELKKAITEIGYDADDMVANQKSHDKLPACCQKDVEPH
jgi:cation transport ATPase